MGFSIKVPDGLRNIAYVFGRKIDGDVKRELERALEDEVTEISIRTRKGKDYEGNSFKAYSPSYKARLVEKYGAANVDLSVTGTMLENMRSKVEHKGGYLEGRLYFQNQSYVRKGKEKEVPTVRNVARWNNATRRFFGLSKEQVIRITKRMKDALNVRR